MSIFDQNQRPIPVCNYLDPSTKGRLFISDSSGYEKAVEIAQRSKKLAGAASAATVVLMCIFSMNFQVSNWSSGNILTFALGILAFLVTVGYGKKFAESHSSVTQLRKEGMPCMENNQDKNTTVHCSVPRSQQNGEGGALDNFLMKWF